MENQVVFDKTLEARMEVSKDVTKLVNSKESPKIYRQGTPEFEDRQQEALRRMVETNVRYAKEESEVKIFLSELAQQYVNAIEDATLEDSYPWLEGLATRATDHDQKAKILSLAKNSSPHGSWSEAIKKALKIKKVKSSPVSIRGINYDLYTEARSQAIREGKNIGEWINEAIKEKLGKQG